MVTANLGLNYGQFREDSLPVEKYQLYLDKDEFIAATKDAYNKTREEIHADDIARDETSEFTASDYAELEVMFNFQKGLAEIIQTYLGREIFANVLPLDIAGGYVINSTDIVKVSNDGVLMEGRAFRVS